MAPSKQAKILTNISPSSQEREENFHIPGEIVETILAYLPIKDAFRASTVSKIFINSWKICRNLSFTREIASKFSREEFTQFISNFFLNFSGTAMCRFCLYFDPTDQVDLVQHWVHKVVQYGITELDLDFTRGKETPKLSSFLANIDSLHILKLNKCELDFKSKPRVFCLHLQQITLQNAPVTLFTLHIVFSICLNLRTFECINCEFLYKLNILAPALKKFAVLLVKNCTGILSIRINAPSLRTIHYFGKICEIRFENHLPNLKDVILDIVSPRVFQFLSHRKEMMIALLRVTKLAVNHTFLEGLCPRFDGIVYKEMTFHLWSLKELHVLIGGESNVTPLDIAIFLTKCPFVEMLSIELGRYAFADCPFWERQGRTNFQRFISTFPFLRLVKIKGFAVKEMHVSMARFFLRNAQYLQSLKIVRARNDMPSLMLTPEWLTEGMWTNATIEINEYSRDKSSIFQSV